MGTSSSVDAKILAAEDWARKEIAKLGSRPVSICPKPDDLLYAEIDRQARESKILACLHFVCECFEADRFHEPRPVSLDPRFNTILEKLDNPSLGDHQ